MRYVVADGSIGEAGRKVKCASCGHQWFQEPVAPTEEPQPEIVLEDALRRKEKPAPAKPADIPDGVKPQGETLPPVTADNAKAMRDKDLIAKVCGFFGAFLVFLVLFLMLAVFKGPVVKAFPPSVMFYELIKLEPPVPGKGLVIDQLHAEIKDDALVIEGRLINLTTKDIAIPPLRISILDEAGAEIGAQPVTIEADTLKAESDIPLTLSVPVPDKAGVSLKAGFTLP